MENPYLSCDFQMTLGIQSAERKGVLYSLQAFKRIAVKIIHQSTVKCRLKLCFVGVIEIITFPLYF